MLILKKLQKIDMALLLIDCGMLMSGDHGTDILDRLLIVPSLMLLNLSIGVHPIAV